MNVLCIGLRTSMYGGYYALHSRNVELLNEISDNYYSYDLYSITDGGICGKIKKGLGGNYFRTNQKVIDEVYSIIEEKKISFVFISNSLCSYLSYVIKSKYKDVKVVTFFHNCEYSYFMDELKIKFLNIVSFLHMIFAFKTEKLAIKYSDYIWGLNDRDSQNVTKYYGKSFDLIIPTSIKDSVGEYMFHIPQKKLKLLFVGSDFYANVHGLNWFVRHVLKYIDAHLFVVGNGMEKYKFNLPNISVIGFVDDLTPYYLNADIVVSPIFLGSGMKTKIAEAMMFSKPILGTAESFEGYDLDFDKIGGLCNSSDDFINKIKLISSDLSTLEEYSSYSREMFLHNFEYNHTLNLVANFLNLNIK